MRRGGRTKDVGSKEAWFLDAPTFAEHPNTGGENSLIARVRAGRFSSHDSGVRV